MENQIKGVFTTTDGHKIEMSMDKNQLAALTAEQTKPKRWRAKYGDVYYFVDSDGPVESNEEVGDEHDDYFHASGNYDKTKEEALQRRADNLGRMRLRDRIAELNGDWKAKFVDEQQQNWCFEQTDEVLCLYRYHGTQTADTWKYFKSVEIGEQLQKEFTEEELRKYLF